MTFRDRVLQEKQLLDEKIFRLQQFIFGECIEDLPNAEQSRLRVQLAIMNAYSVVLGERLTHEFK